jgi:hypothetical protein
VAYLLYVQLFQIQSSILSATSDKSISCVLYPAVPRDLSGSSSYSTLKPTKDRGLDVGCLTRPLVKVGGGSLSWGRSVTFSQRIILFQATTPEACTAGITVGGIQIWTGQLTSYSYVPPQQHKIWGSNRITPFNPYLIPTSNSATPQRLGMPDQVTA